MNLSILGQRPRMHPSVFGVPSDEAAKMRADQAMLTRLHQTQAGPQLQNALFGGQAMRPMSVRSTRPSARPSRGNLGALQAARSQIGVRERTGRNDGVPAQRYSNGRREPWCANFVSWAYRKAGKPLPGNQRSLASVQYMEDQMKEVGKFHRGTPKPGDIIFFKNRGASDRGRGRHVGMVERVANGRVYTIEGNSGNRVRRRSYPLNASRISGYGRP